MGADICGKERRVFRVQVEVIAGLSAPATTLSCGRFVGSDAARCSPAACIQLRRRSCGSHVDSFGYIGCRSLFPTIPPVHGIELPLQAIDLAKLISKRSPEHRILTSTPAWKMPPMHCGSASKAKLQVFMRLNGFHRPCSVLELASPGKILQMHHEACRRLAARTERKHINQHLAAVVDVQEHWLVVLQCFRACTILSGSHAIWPSLH